MNRALAVAIQKKLRNLGIYKGRLDGLFGNRSKLALANFQKLHGLVPDGIYGTKTEDELFEADIADRDLDLVSYIKDSVYPHESQVELEKFYGKVGTNLTKIKLPYRMFLAWDERKSVTTMTCHKKVAKDLLGIFEDTLEYYGKDGIRLLGLDLFGGCYNKRKIRGGTRWSTHAWGISVDLDPAHNRLRWKSNRARFAREEYDKFWDIVESHGATSLGREKDYDWMHFQFAYR